MTTVSSTDTGARQVRTAPSPDAPPRPPGRTGPRPARWWREVVLVAAFYAAYTAIRDWRGTRPVSATQAYHHAEQVIGLERTLGIFHEAAIQRFFLHDRFVVRLLDDWYGSTHFVVTAAVLIALFFVAPDRYRCWRNTLAGATALALVGFALYPLMPPRLLPASYGFEDTLRVVGGLWNFDSGPMTHLSNQFAAMPSLHFAWALWSGLALAAMLRPWWAKALAGIYPAITLLCVIVTANHLFTDTAVGALTVGVGYAAARLVERARSASMPADPSRMVLTGR